MAGTVAVAQASCLLAQPVTDTLAERRRSATSKMLVLRPGSSIPFCGGGWKPPNVAYSTLSYSIGSIVADMAP